MGLLEECEQLFKTSHLYEVIGVIKAASEAEVRRGYYKVSLTVHPDRVPDDEQATAKFQTLGKVYAVLSDKDQRAVYDEQGIVDEDSHSVDRNRNWEEYWRMMFPQITVQDILDFEKSYKGTDEEREDLMRVYKESNGDMNKIMQSVLCAAPEDEERFRGVLQGAVDGGELPAYEAFTRESVKKKNSRKRRDAREAREAEQLRNQMGMTSNSNLATVMKRRRQTNEVEFNYLIANLEGKYCKKNTSSKKGKK